MANNNDALERIRNRARPVVPARDASLTSRPVDISTPVSQGTASHVGTSIPGNLNLDFPADVVFNAELAKGSQNKDSGREEVAIPVAPGTSTPVSQGTVTGRTLDTSTLSHPIVEVPEAEVLNTKQSTMRLEKDLSERLQKLSRDNGVCREALIEAMFEFIEANPNIRAEVLNVAQGKNEQRQAIANHKRAQSMMERFLQK
jgi:predicted DNA-binding protein